MKLVELLARELKAWPDGAEFYCQDYNRNAYPYEVKPERHEHREVLWGGKGQLSGVSAAFLSDIASDHATAIVTRTDWAAERARIAKPAKNAEGWIRHRGGKCPVDKGVLVDVRFRNGDILEGVHALESNGSAHPYSWSAGIEFWKKDDVSADIMAYRLHKPAELVEPFLEVVQAFNALAKVPQIDGPTGWRDRIAEIDVEVQARTAERAELVQKLASEGFALIGRAPDAPICLPREEWKIGDLVVLSEKTGKSNMPTGIPLPITFFDGSSDGQDVKVDDFYYPPVCDLIWHSRPSA